MDEGAFSLSALRLLISHLALAPSLYVLPGSQQQDLSIRSVLSPPFSHHSTLPYYFLQLPSRAPNPSIHPHP